MKLKMNIILAAILVMLGALITMSLKGSKTTGAVPQAAFAAPTGSPVPQVTSSIALRAPIAPIPIERVPMSAAAMPVASAEPDKAPAALAAQSKQDTVAASNLGEKLGYTAVQGDTLSNIAVGLKGSDTKANRNAVIAANPSLQADPDRVLAGKTYVLALPVTPSAAPALPQIQSPGVPTTQPQAADAARPVPDRVLRYTAQPGDNVAVLAAGFLGSDSKSNRDAIISRNESLQNDPDHVVVGKTYKIPTSTGLSAAPIAATASSPSPTTQPDADGVVQIGTGRELRYTARAGDNVSKLAQVLLGSDTQANRDAIINNNASLKSDPDRVVAGQTYWIPAPVATIER